MTATRPRLHFTVREGWINDPLGLTFHGGEYHLFYQFVPGRTVWSPDQRWGHATSPDLLHWTERDVALTPGDGDDGAWSGSIAVPEEGPAALFYTAVHLGDLDDGRVRIARPTDDTWDTWMKGDVVAAPPPGLDLLAFRDPWVMRDGAGWRMVLGCGLTDGTATALGYVSDDLEHWTYDGVIASRHREELDPVWAGAGWECPQLFPLGGDWVLTFSVWEPDEIHYEAYAVGALVDGRFTARNWGRLSWGPSYYAGSAFLDRDGARGLIYWLRGVTDPAGRWAGAHSVPHTLRLDGDRVVAEPHAAVAAARAGHPVHVRDAEVEIALQSDVIIDLDQRSSRATLDLDDGGLQLRARGAELAATTRDGTWTMPIGGRGIRVVLDGPAVEIFTERGTMAVVIPSGSDRRTLRLAGGAGAEVWGLT